MRSFNRAKLTGKPSAPIERPYFLEARIGRFHLYNMVLYGEASQDLEAHWQDERLEWSLMANVSRDV